MKTEELKNFTDSESNVFFQIVALHFAMILPDASVSAKVR